MLVAYASFVVFGSLVPLDYQPVPFGVALDRFAAIPYLNLGVASRADWVANLLLFIPLAFLASAALAEGRHGRIWHLVLVVCAAGCFSVTLEFIQLYFPPRTVSQNDIIAETLGALAGSTVYRWCGPWVIRWSSGFFEPESRQGRLRRILFAYLALLLAYNLLPLDLTFDLGLLYTKWKNGGVILIPFAGYKGGLVEIIYAIATDVVLWMPVAGLLLIEGRRPRDVVLLTMVAATAIELGQTFVFTRVTDLTDILMAGVGAWIVVPLVSFLRRNKVSASTFSAWAAPAFVIWGLILLAIFWWPYNFEFSLFGGGRVESLVERVPFETYYLTSEFHAINELLRKMSFFAPLGIFWALRRGQALAGGIIFLFSACLVEVGQLALPDKVADLTDVALEVAGACIGFWLTKNMLGLSNVAPAPYAVPTPTPINKVSRIRGDLRPAIVPALAWIGLCLLPSLPGVPYNVRELFGGGLMRLWSAAGMTLYIWSLTAGLLLCQYRAVASGVRSQMLSLALLAHGTLAFLCLYSSVPIESLDDVLGSPVLGWPPVVEHALRFIALNAAVALPAVIGSSVALVAYQRQQVGALITSLIHSIWVVPLMYWAIVANASTDNLTELMRQGAVFSSFLELLVAIAGLWLAATALAGLLSGQRRRSLGLTMIIIGCAVAVGSSVLALEPMIVKYGKVFSAWQFLLSADREHYVHGAALAVRGIAVLGGLVTGAAVLMWSVWHRGRSTAPLPRVHARRTGRLSRSRHQHAI